MRCRAAFAPLLLLVLVLGGLAACTRHVSGAGRAAPTCAAVFFGVAGSGEGPRNPAPARRPAGVDPATAQAFGPTVGSLAVQLHRLAGPHLATAAAIDYPAIPATQYLGLGGLSPKLDASEAQGVRTLRTDVRLALAGRCARRPVLLAGYSQGAEVVIRAVRALPAAQRANVTVALLGNPSFQPRRPGDYPAGAGGAGLRPTFLGQAYALPADVRARTIDVCAPGDPVCGVDPSLRSLVSRLDWVLGHLSVHDDAYAFGRAGYPRTAARFLWAHRVE